MISIDVITPDGGTGGTVDLPADVFDVAVNVPLLHQVVVAQLAAARQGTASTKTRGDVRGGGAKPYRQKGTGRARQGSTRAPQFVGGGVVHGPSPRSYAQRTPKKMKAAALRGALSDRARDGRVHVLSALLEGDVPSTNSVLATVRGVTEARHVLVVVDRDDTLAWKSLRNIGSVHSIAPDQLNTYDVLVSDEVIFTQTALEAFLANVSRGRPVERDEPVVAKAAKKTAVKKTAVKAKTATKAAAKVSDVKASEDKPSDDADADAKDKAAKLAKAKKAKAARAAKAAKAKVTKDESDDTGEDTK